MVPWTTERFSQLVEQYERLVYTVCFQLVRDAAAAEDLTQETFLSETETQSVTSALIDGEWVLVEDNN